MSVLSDLHLRYDDCQSLVSNGSTDAEGSDICTCTNDLYDSVSLLPISETPFEDYHTHWQTTCAGGSESPEGPPCLSVSSFC